MTTGTIIVSTIMGIAYGWASAYSSGANRLMAPQILQSQIVNVLISFSALATIVFSGIHAESLWGSVFSFLIIFSIGMITNLRINRKIQKILDRRK